MPQANELNQIANILATGYLRLLANRSKPLPPAKLQSRISDLSPCYERPPEA